MLAAVEQARAELDELRRRERNSNGRNDGDGMRDAGEPLAPVTVDGEPNDHPDAVDEAATPHPAARPGCGQDSSAEDSPPGGERTDAGWSDISRSSDRVSVDCGGNSSAEEPTASRADGLIRLAVRYLDEHGQQRPDAARRSRSRLTVRLDPLSGWARLPDGELLPPTAALAVCDLGRDRREPDQALRELLGSIDGERCRFPGCTRRRKLHAHHVREWFAGGRTDLANLILLCARHHTLVHADGYRLTLRPDRRLNVATADGAAIPHLSEVPRQAAAGLDPQRAIRADTLPPHAAQPRIDLGYAVSVLMQQAA